jgi:uncharacterized protein YcsI (UPF0317 family)
MNHQTLPQTPKEVRDLIRSDQWLGVTAGVAPGYVQANLAILPKELAFDFLLFCQRNPKPCPLLEVIEAGLTEPRLVAAGADIRTDVPGYRVFLDGESVADVTNLHHHWRDDLVSFLLGCSFTFESALVNAGIHLRHIIENKNVSMFITNIETVPSGVFRGPMVVSMRPIQRSQVVRAVQVTSRFPSAHGAPIHIGDPSAIGIENLDSPDFGDPTVIKEDEVPVFWACGVTPQVVAIRSRPSLLISHVPGQMFITDLRDENISVL